MRAAGLLAAAILAAGAAWAADAGGACPAAGAARLGRPVRTLRDMAASAAVSEDPACVSRGLALADLIDRPGRSACSAAERVALDVGAGDADMLAYRAALLWRCGRVREAHRAARAALEADPATTLGWRVLGLVLEARFRDAAARAAFGNALALDPEDTPSLNGFSEVADSRAARRDAIARFLAAGPARGEVEEALKGARESLAFLDALGDRQVWVLEKADLPGALALDPLIDRPGRVAGWIARIDLGRERRVPALVDSGASGLYLDARLAAPVGLEPLAAGTLLGGGGTGEHATERGTVPRVLLGPLTFKDGLGFVGAGSLHERGYYRAILGLDVFGGLLLRFDPHRRSLALEEAPPRDDDVDPLAVEPWPRAPTDVPVLQIAGQLLIPVTHRGDGVVESLALLDTGAASTLLDESVAERLGSFRHGGMGPGTAFGGAMAIVGVVPLATVRSGPFEERLRDVAVIDLSLRTRLAGVAIGGFVGEDVWSRVGFELDLASGVLRARGR